MNCIIFTPIQADDIKALIATLEGGVIRPHFTVNPHAGKLLDGSYALQETILTDMAAEEIDYVPALASIGIDADTLPRRDVQDNEWDRTNWDV